MESVVSDAIVILERRDGLWAAVMFPAAEIRALEDPCREQRGHQLSGVLSSTPAMPTRCLEQRPGSHPSPGWPQATHSASVGLTVPKLKEGIQAQPLLVISKAGQPTQEPLPMERSSWEESGGRPKLTPRHNYEATNVCGME